MDNDFSNLFYFEHASHRMIGFAANASLVHDSGARAVAACAQLLNRETKQPSGKWLWLQMQPEEAIALAASILAVAEEKGWPIPPDYFEKIARLRLGKKPVSN